MLRFTFTTDPLHIIFVTQEEQQLLHSTQYFKTVKISQITTTIQHITAATNFLIHLSFLSIYHRLKFTFTQQPRRLHCTWCSLDLWRCVVAAIYYAILFFYAPLSSGVNLNPFIIITKRQKIFKKTWCTHTLWSEQIRRTWKSFHLIPSAISPVIHTTRHHTSPPPPLCIQPKYTGDDDKLSMAGTHKENILSILIFLQFFLRWYDIKTTSSWVK